jgi:hypothetical protein
VVQQFHYVDTDYESDGDPVINISDGNLQRYQRFSRSSSSSSSSSSSLIVMDPSSVCASIRVSNECLPKFLSEVSIPLRTGLYYDSILPSLRCAGHQRKTRGLTYRTSTARMDPEALVDLRCWIHSFAQMWLLGFQLQRHRRSASNNPQSRTGKLRWNEGLRCRPLVGILGNIL